MRLGEILELQWTQVHFDPRRQHVRILLESGETKTAAQRQVVMPGEIYTTFLAWHSESRVRYPACPWVCH